MAKVLIPFTDPANAERAVRRLLDESSPSALDVELLAVVEPLTPGKVRMFLSPGHAEDLARAAAVQWLTHLGALLAAAGVPYRSEIAVGRAGPAIAAAVRHKHVDRVLLPGSSPWWLSALGARWRSARLTRAAHHPVIVVP